MAMILFSVLTAVPSARVTSLWTAKTRGFQTTKFRKVGQSNHKAAECGIITDTDKGCSLVWTISL